MTVDELRAALAGVRGDRIVYVQVLAARRQAITSYSEDSARMVGNPLDADVEHERSFIISA